MKIIRLVSLILLLPLLGCATMSSIRNSYKKINFSDGIDINEAKIIAKNEIIKTDAKNEYKIIGPEACDIGDLNAKAVTNKLFKEILIRNEDIGREYPNSWIVVFHPKLLSFFSISYLVVIDKNTGEVKLSKEDSAIGDILEPMLKPLIDSISVSNVFIVYYSANKKWPSDKQELDRFIVIETEGKNDNFPLFSRFSDSIKFYEDANGSLVVKAKDSDTGMSFEYIIEPLDGTGNKFTVSVLNGKGLNNIFTSFSVEKTGDKISVKSNLSDNPDVQGQLRVTLEELLQ